MICIPLGESTEAVAEGGGGAEAEVGLEGCCVCVGDGNIPGLHRLQFFVGLEVVVGGEDAGTDEFFLKDGDKVKEVFGRTVADVIQFIWRHGEPVITGVSLGSMLHNADNAFYDVINIGKVAFAVSVVEDFYCLTFK